MSSWHETTIGELLRQHGGSIKTGPFGTVLKAHEYSRDGVPLISVGEVGYGELRVTNGTPRAPKEVVLRLPEFILRAGDIVFGRKGAVDRSALVRPAEDGWFLGSDGIRLRLPSVCDPRFVALTLRTAKTKAWLLQHATGTTMASLNQGIIERVPLPLPPLPEQRAIAGVLGALDDKIELNRRMNETLEEIARALFKSWFVDFDPVRAKSEGRQPWGMDAETAALFPSEFEDSELGEIPKGWRVATVYEFAEVVYGAPFASSQFNTEGRGEPLVRIRDLPGERPGIWTDEVHPKGYRLVSGDIVVGMDGEFRAYLWGGAPAWLNQRVCVFKPTNGASAAFVRNSITRQLAEVEATETATTVIHLGKHDIDRFRVILPSSPVLSAFNRVAQPLYDRIVAAKSESRTLAELRDTLLPKLMSGEVRVRDAERAVEAAG